MKSIDTVELKVKTLNFPILCVGLLLLCSSIFAEPQRAWVKQMPAEGRTITALKSDGHGGVYVVGYQNTNNQAEYFAHRYSGSGELLWQKNYGAGNGTNNTPRGVAVGENGDLFVTGTSKTVAYSPDGTEKWVAPYAGRALAVGGTNVFVTGYLNGYLATVSLSSNEGTNRWAKTFRYMEPPADVYAPDFSGAVQVGVDGSVYVAGSSATLYYGHIANHFLFSDKGETVVKYNPDGGLLGSYVNVQLSVTDVNIFNIATSSNKTIVTANYTYGYYCTIFDNSFNLKTNHALIYPDTFESGLVLFNSNFYSTSRRFDPEANILYNCVSKVDSKNNLLFGIKIQNKNYASDRINSIVNIANSKLWLAGTQTALRQLPDMVFYVVNEAGQAVWNDHYNATADSADTAAAADTDSSGNVYAAGYSSTPSGEQKLVLLKYTQTAINKQANGNMLLQFPGEPGKQLKVEATPTLVTPDWMQIGLGQVPSNGLFQLEDTNANLFPSRFYRSVTTP